MEKIKMNNHIKTNKLLNLLFLVVLFIFTFTFTSCKKENTKVIDGVTVTCYSIHTDAQEKYLKGNYDRAHTFAKGEEELSKPKSIKLSFDKSYDNAWLLVSEKNDFSQCFIEKKINGKECEIVNLKIKTIYYYKLVTNDETKSDLTEAKAIYVDNDCIRNLTVDGITNVRDVGGWMTKGGKRTNQGLIYRTSRLNENETTDKLITDKGIDTMLNQLKVKTELDLRRVDNNETGGITISPLGDSVQYISVPMNSEGNIMRLNNSCYPEIFEIFSKEENYPIFFHCSIGTDRTGFIAFMFNCLLGVEEDNLYRDYLFSNFALINTQRYESVLQKYFDVIEPYEGTTNQEKMYNYLIMNKVDKNNIDKFIEIMGGDPINAK